MFGCLFIGYFGNLKSIIKILQIVFLCRVLCVNRYSLLWGLWCVRKNLEPLSNAHFFQQVRKKPILRRKELLGDMLKKTVLTVFADYLRCETDFEVMLTSRGYIMGGDKYREDGILCNTPPPKALREIIATYGK